MGKALCAFVSGLKQGYITEFTVVSGPEME